MAPSQPVQVLHRDLSTQNQLGMLIAVVQTMTGVLFTQERESENIPGQHPLLGEAKIAAENTFRKACERIDTIIEDTARWTLEFQKRLEKMLEENHTISMGVAQQQQEAFKAQQVAAEEVSSPHFRYKPTLYQLQDGSWLAFLGDLENMDAGIFGQGVCPADALQEFDDRFRGKLPKAVKAWLAQREQDIENGKELKPYPNEQNISPPTVDTQGIGGTEAAPE